VGSVTTIPAYAKYLLAAAAAADFAGIYFGMVYPRVGWLCIGVAGVINAFSAYLGWGALTPPTTSST
jgi:hypothetical protein